MPLRALVAALLALVALALGAGSAVATSDVAIGIADDAALLKEPDTARAAATVDAWADLGIDDVRMFAAWEAISPANDRLTAPAGFDPANPDSPGYNWAFLDRAIGLVRAADMTVTLVVSGPGPLWASQVPGRRQVRYKPRPDLFGSFAAAVAKRYGAAVDRYVLWNEPNFPLWLQPQYTCQGRRCTPYAPHLYRKLVRAAYPAIKAADPRSTILFGALGPRGDRPLKRNSTTKPLAFLRALGCVKPTLRRDRRGPCAGFKALTADGFAYHPHSVFKAPDEANPDLDEAAIADLTRLKTTLDATQKAGGLKNAGGGRFHLYFDEYGYQTRPPDPDQGISLARQSRWLQQGAYIAWRDPRVKLLTQYAWRDEVIGRGGVRATKYSGWQSGLRFADGRGKPILTAFSNVFHAERRAPRQVRLWGQVRPGDQHSVTVERRRVDRTRWTTLRTLTTDRNGSWKLDQPLRSAVEYRYSWQPFDEYGAPLGLRRSSDVLRVRSLNRRGR